MKPHHLGFVNNNFGTIKTMCNTGFLHKRNKSVYQHNWDYNYNPNFMFESKKSISSNSRNSVNNDKDKIDNKVGDINIFSKRSSMPAVNDKAPILVEGNENNLNQDIVTSESVSRNKKFKMVRNQTNNTQQPQILFAKDKFQKN